jgi:hypothetical protein
VAPPSIDPHLGLIECVAKSAATLIIHLR